MGIQSKPRRMKWIIVNSCGTRCFSEKAFDTYEDGWDFLYCEFPSENEDDREDMLDEYFVIKSTECHQGYIGGLYIANY